MGFLEIRGEKWDFENFQIRDYLELEIEKNMWSHQLLLTEICSFPGSFDLRHLLLEICSFPGSFDLAETFGRVSN